MKSKMQSKLVAFVSIFCIVICSCLFCFAINLNVAQAEELLDIKATFGFEEGIALKSNGSFLLRLNTSTEVSESMTIWGSDDETVATVEVYESDSGVPYGYEAIVTPTGVGITTIWAATELYILSGVDNYIEKSVQARLTLNVTDTIETLSITVQNTADKTNFAPNDTAVAKLVLNGKDNVLNANADWQMMYNKTLVEDYSILDNTSSLRVTSLVKGKYQFTATVNETSATAKINVITESLNTFNTKVLPYLCLVLLIGVACLPIFKKKKNALQLCLEQAELIQSSLQKVIAKIDDPKYTEKKKYRIMYNSIWQIKLIAMDLHSRVYAINLDQLNQCEAIVIKTEALAKSLEAVTSTKKVMPFDKQCMVLNKLTQNYIPTIIDAIKKMIEAYQNANTAQPPPKDVLFRFRIRRPKSKIDYKNYLDNMFKLGDADD